ncbi:MULTISPECIES: hypothetical protein [unclassified Agrobacterium]|uniref:hypothetical protein n=1 Tax=unclassified Agrobacterium TaxID=2632611 RepID=UPI0010081E05|nr:MULTISPECIES: hypothetical protein [unclassified Agrobacterium]QKW99957.1 hypothetical protein GSF67_23000 [Agrobacterium sp. CGMCC 11546]
MKTPGCHAQRAEADAKWSAVVSLRTRVFGLVAAEFLPVSRLPGGKVQTPAPEARAFKPS